MSARLGRHALAISTALAVAGVGLVAGPTSPATAKTIKVCVNKKTGEIRMVKKCKKGWKKRTWRSTGPQGPTGPQGSPGSQGTQLSVKDGNGTVIGTFLSLNYGGPLGGIFVEISGGWYDYSPSGRLWGTGDRPFYTDSACGSTAYMAVSTSMLADVLPSAGGPNRIVQRVTEPTWGPTRAFVITSTTVPSATFPTLYYRTASDACQQYGPPNVDSTLVVLQPVAAPPDFPGPLSIG